MVAHHIGNRSYQAMAVASLKKNRVIRPWILCAMARIDLCFDDDKAKVQIVVTAVYRLNI
jgi:hypothetical protein